MVEKKEALANLNGKGKVSEDMKLAFHIAKWVNKGDGDLSQSKFIGKYFDTANEVKVVSKKINMRKLCFQATWLGVGLDSFREKIARARSCG